MNNKILLVVACGVALLLMLILVPVAFGLAGLANQNGNSCDAPTSGETKNVFALGDSIMVGLSEGAAPLAKEFKSQGIEAEFDASGGRSLSYGGSTGNKLSGLEAARQDKEKIAAADTVIVELGTNNSPGDFTTDAKKLLSIIKDANSSAKIYWVKIFSGGIVDEWRDEYNRVIEGLDSVTPIETTVHGYSSRNDPQKIHPTGDGYQKLAGTISGALGDSGTADSGSNCEADTEGNGEYRFPLDKSVKFVPGRTDMGVDIETDPSNFGKPIRAIGDGTVVTVQPMGAFGPTWMCYELSSGSHKGDTVFIGHSGPVIAQPGTKVKAGDPLIKIHGGDYGGPVGHLEIGWGNKDCSWTLSASLGHYHHEVGNLGQGSITTEGKSFRAFLNDLSNNKLGPDHV